MAEHVAALAIVLAVVMPWSDVLWQIQPQRAADDVIELGPREQLPDLDLEGPQDGGELDPGGGIGEPSPPPDGTPGIVAEDDAARTPAGTAVRIDYAANDSYDRTVEVEIGPPGRGEIVRGDDVDPHVVYTPDDDLTVGDVDTFTYTVCAATGEPVCDSATVTVDVIDDSAMSPETEGGTVVERAGPTAPAVCQEPLPWGGHDNGRIPATAMREIGGGHRLKPDAADAFLAMREAAAADGVTIGLTDSYRSFEAQVAVRAAKGGVVATATPGTSVHGWGKALDLKVRDPRIRAWLEQHSRDYAWINPPWAKRPGKSFEPWHYEFYGTGADPGNPQCAGIGAALTGGSGEAATADADLDAGLVSATGVMRPVGLGLGALVALASAAAIVVRDLQRGRRIREPPR